LAVLLQVGQSPVADLYESEAENGLLSLDGLLHFLHVGALFHDGYSIVSLGGSALLRIRLLGSTLFGVSSGLELSNVRYDLLLQSHGEKLVQPGVGEGVEASQVSAFSGRLVLWVFSFREG